MTKHIGKFTYRIIILFENPCPLAVNNTAMATWRCNLIHIIRMSPCDFHNSLNGAYFSWMLKCSKLCTNSFYQLMSIGLIISELILNQNWPVGLFHERGKGKPLGGIYMLQKQRNGRIRHEETG
jgi:hypothetical protein